MRVSLPSFPASRAILGVALAGAVLGELACATSGGSRGEVAVTVPAAASASRDPRRTLERDAAHLDDGPVYVVARAETPLLESGDPSFPTWATTNSPTLLVVLGAPANGYVRVGFARDPVDPDSIELCSWAGRVGANPGGSFSVWVSVDSLEVVLREPLDHVDPSGSRVRAAVGTVVEYRDALPFLLDDGFEVALDAATFATVQTGVSFDCRDHRCLRADEEGPDVCSVPAEVASASLGFGSVGAFTSIDRVVGPDNRFQLTGRCMLVDVTNAPELEPWDCENAGGGTEGAALGILGASIGSGVGIGGLGLGGLGIGSGGGTGIGTIGARGAAAPSGPRVMSGTPQVAGGISGDAVRRVVLRHSSEVRHCYEVALTTRPGVSGRLVVDFVVDATGAVSVAHVVENAMSSVDIGACIEGAVRRWAFPASTDATATRVRYPFVFTNDGSGPEVAPVDTITVDANELLYSAAGNPIGRMDESATVPIDAASSRESRTCFVVELVGAVDARTLACVAR